MAKILIFTAKWPFSSYEIDGGSVTVSQYVSILSQNNELDYLYLKKNNIEIPCNVCGIHKLEVVDGSYLDYHTYNSVNSNKFLTRLENIEYNNKLIKDRIDNYDLVVIVHCLQAMGLEKILTPQQLKKVVVLPMLLSDAYIQSGDIVPQEYIAAEKNILQAVGNIITPSANEKDYMVNTLKVEPSKIAVIPRAVGKEFVGCPHKLDNDCIKLCYVASFKNQKNNIDAIKVIKSLNDKKINAQLHLIGTIQDKSVYQECLNLINTQNLQEKVVIHPIMSQEDLAKFYQKMDFNISTSLSETFGRSIFEGLAMGLPTLAYSCLEEVINLTQKQPGIVFVANVEDMADEIISILSSKSYETLSKQAMEIGHNFAYSTQEQKLISTIEQIIVNNKIV